MHGEAKKSLLIINATVINEEGLVVLDDHFDVLFLFNLVDVSAYLQSNRNLGAIVIDIRSNTEMYSGYAAEINKVKGLSSVPIFLFGNKDFDFNTVEHFPNLHFVYRETFLPTLQEIVGFEKVKFDSENHYSQNGGFTLLRFDLEGQFLSATISERTRNMLGYSSSELESFISDELLSLVYNEDRVIAMRDIKLVSGSSSVMTDNFRINGKNKTLWLKISAKRIIQDSIVYIFLQLKDITKEKTAEMRSSVIIDSVPHGIALLLKREDGYYTNFFNQSIFNERGFDVDRFKTITQSNALSLIYPEDVDVVRDCLDKILQTKQKGFIEYRAYNKDGVLHYYNLIGNYLLADNGEPAVCVIISDITEQKLVESQLRFEGVVIDSMPGGVCVVIKNDEAFSMVYTNDAFLTLRGFDENDKKCLFTGDCFKFVSESDRLKMHLCFNEILRTKQKQIVTYSAKMKNGDERTYSLTGNYFTWKDEQPAVCSVIVDITDLVKAEEKSKAESAIIELMMQEQFIVLVDYDRKKDTLRLKNRNKETLIENYIKDYINSPNTYLSSEFATKIKEIYNNIDDPSNQITFDSKAPIFTEENTWCRTKVIKVRDEESKVIRLVGRIGDVREEHVLLDNVQSLEKRVVIDPLTDLYNYQESKKLIIEAITKLKKNTFGALLILDIDDFKKFNDQFGHQVGNAVLLSLSQVLKSSFRSYDIIGRFGGDEFIIYINNIKEKEALVTRVEHLMAAVKSIDLQIETHINCSVGACIIEDPSIEYEKAFTLADVALYEAKNSGKDTYRIKQ